MSHIRNVGLRGISYSNKPGACQAQKRCSKAFTISPKGGPRFGVQKTGPVWGSVFYVNIARYSFSNMEPKKRGPFFHLKIVVSFCTFSVVAIALLRLRGCLFFYSHFQFWQAYNSDSGLLVCCLAAKQQTSVAYWEDTLHVPGLEGGFETHFLEPSKSIVWA